MIRRDAPCRCPWARGARAIETTMEGTSAHFDASARTLVEHALARLHARDECPVLIRND